MGISKVNVLYRRKQEQLEQSALVASSVEAKIKQREGELRRMGPGPKYSRKALLFSAATNS